MILRTIKKVKKPLILIPILIFILLTFQTTNNFALSTILSKVDGKTINQSLGTTSQTILIAQSEPTPAPIETPTPAPTPKCGEPPYSGVFGICEGGPCPSPGIERCVSTTVPPYCACATPEPLTVCRCVDEYGWPVGGFNDVCDPSNFCRGPCSDTTRTCRRRRADEVPITDPPSVLMAGACDCFSTPERCMDIIPPQNAGAFAACMAGACDDPLDTCGVGVATHPDGSETVYCSCRTAVDCEDTTHPEVSCDTRMCNGQLGNECFKHTVFPDWCTCAPTCEDLSAFCLGQPDPVACCDSEYGCHGGGFCVFDSNVPGCVCHYVGGSTSSTPPP